jgi:hypothetical protein
MRGELLEQLRAGDPDELHRADPRVEEAIERSVLPSWSDAASTLASLEKKGSRTKLRNTLVGEWGFPEACADDLVDHGIRLASRDGDRRGGILRRSD